MLDIRRLRITTLSDNAVGHARCIAEWGLCVHIDAGGREFLLDSGSGTAAARNAAVLDLSLEQAEAIVLSHGHWDHTGGLPGLLEMIRPKHDLPVFGHPDLFLEKYSYQKKTRSYRYSGIQFTRGFLESLGATFRLSPDPIWLSDDVVTSGEVELTNDYEAIPPEMCIRNGETYLPDTMRDDLFIAVVTNAGLVIITGCAHRGVVNSIRHARKITGVEHVHLVVGGTHLIGASDERIAQTIRDLKEIDPDWIGVSHCTGLYAAGILQHHFGEKFFHNTSGTRLTFPIEPFR